VLGALTGFLVSCWIGGKIDEEIERERLWKHKGKVYRLTPIE
jgi:hypothetical protein